MTFYEIDGQQVFPNDGTIKVTKENPFIKESDSYTYDVTLPLSIKANRDVIGNLNRLDVQKKAKTFDMCRIYADNRLLISGTGTMTAISNTDVKIQIVAGNSEVKYKSKLKNDFIDNINYPNVSSDYEEWGAGKKIISDNSADKILTDGYYGEEGKYTFNTIYDETNDRVANLFYASTNSDKSAKDIFMICDIAVQPNLIYILHKIFEYMGYAVKSDVYDEDPWNTLYIASARITTILKYALPHWKIQTFLEEFRKLFNATYVFDETGKTVKIVRADSVTGNEVTNYDASDEFSSDYDDDGVEYLGSSNIKYNLRDSTKRSEIDELSTEILQKFTIENYATWDDIETKTATLNGLNSASIGGAAQIKTYLTTLYKGPDGWVYFKNISQEEYDELYKNVTDDSLKNWYVPKKTGFFTQLLRDVSSDENVTLNIVPAAMTILDKHIDYSAYCVSDIPMPCAENTKSDVSTTEEDTYIRTQDVIENSDSEDTDSDTEDERMEVFFLKKGTPLTFPFVSISMAVVVPKTGTDYRALSSTQIGSAETLALDCAKSSDLLDQNGNQISAEFIGKFHSSGLAINPKEQIIIKFLSDDVPDPKKIYIFRNKKYICSKIEIEIKNDKIEKLKTGYFYEMN